MGLIASRDAGNKLTSLRRTEVLAGSGCARASAAGLLDAKGTAVDDFALQAILGSIGLVGGDHLDETESAGLLGMGVLHDLAFLNLTVLLEEARNLAFRQSGMDASHEQVGAGVDGAVFIVVLVATVVFLHVTMTGFALGSRSCVDFGGLMELLTCHCCRWARPNGDGCRGHHREKREVKRFAGHAHIEDHRLLTTRRISRMKTRRRKKRSEPGRCGKTSTKTAWRYSGQDQVDEDKLTFETIAISSLVIHSSGGHDAIVLTESSQLGYVCGKKGERAVTSAVRLLKQRGWHV